MMRSSNLSRIEVRTFALGFKRGVKIYAGNIIMESFIIIIIYAFLH